MNISNYLKNIKDIQKQLNDQRFFYKQFLPVQDSCDAGSQKTTKISISNYGHFLIQKIYGIFSTLYNNNNVITDTGINYLKGKITDASVNRPLFDGYIPFNMLFSPGREKVLIDNSPYPNQLFYPLNFEYLMGMNSDFQLDVQNSSNTSNSYTIMLEGFRIHESYKG